MDPMDAVRHYFTWDELKSSGGTACVVWFPAMIICFALPPHLRVYMNTIIAVFWEVGLAYGTYLGDGAPEVAVKTRSWTEDLVEAESTDLVEAAVRSRSWTEDLVEAESTVV